MAKGKKLKAEPSKLSLEDIIAAAEQLFVREKYELWRWLRRDPALKDY